MGALQLKLAVTLLTLAAAAAAAVQVGAHVRPASAPLHPAVLGPAPFAAAGGRLSLTPSVRTAGAVAPVTSTYAS